MKTLVALRVHPNHPDEIVGTAVLPDDRSGSFLVDVFDGPLALTPAGAGTALLQALTDDGTAVGTVELARDGSSGSFDLGWIRGRLTSVRDAPAA